MSFPSWAVWSDPTSGSALSLLASNALAVSYLALANRTAQVSDCVDQSISRTHCCLEELSWPLQLARIATRRLHMLALPAFELVGRPIASTCGLRFPF